MKSILLRLISWRRSDEEHQWAEKAVDSLYKKLKATPSAIEDLEEALTHPNQPSKCVTIIRSKDGRLQVSHRKGLPHVIYCRVYRWPDLQSHHELRALECCKYPFTSKSQNEVCINPFHYERIETTVLPSIIVPKHNEFAQGFSMIYKQHQDGMDCAPPTVCYSPDGFMQQNSPALPYYSLPQYSPQSQNSPGFPQSPPQQSPIHTSGSASPMMLEDNSSFLPLSPAVSSDISENSTTTIPYQESRQWCSISYYELNQRIGETFHALSTHINVDGYTSPCLTGRRFPLGAFTNINRNSTIENTRRHIGKGIHLYYVNKDAYVENISEAAIFVQSRNVNYTHQFHPNTVCKLPPGNSLRIFSGEQFAKLLKDSTNEGYDALFELSKMCVIKLSFVKGWGADYHRQDVTSCPCWIEIRLHSAYTWLDEVMKVLEGSSAHPISSMS